MRLLLIAVFTTLLGCSSTPAPLGERPFNITGFDFSTPLSALLPDTYRDTSYKGERFEGCYLIPSAEDYPILLQRDTIRTRDGVAQFIFCGRCNASQADRPILFAGQHFNAPNLAVSPEGHVIMIGGHLIAISDQDNDAFIARLTAQYGEPTAEYKGWRNDLYTWTLEDRTIKYAVRETSTPVPVIEKDASGRLTNLYNEKPQQALTAYLFVIDAAWVERITSADNIEGDLTHCR